MTPARDSGWSQTRPPEPLADDEPRFSRRGPNSQHTVSHDDPVTREEFDEQMGRVLDRLDDIKDGVNHHLPQMMAQAMAEALRDVLQEPDTARILMTNMRRAATEHAIHATGRGVWAAAGAVLSKWWLILIVLLLVLNVAGWGATMKTLSVLLGFGSEAPK